MSDEQTLTLEEIRESWVEGMLEANPKIAPLDAGATLRALFDAKVTGRITELEAENKRLIEKLKSVQAAYWEPEPELEAELAEANKVIGALWEATDSHDDHVVVLRVDTILVEHRARKATS